MTAVLIIVDEKSLREAIAKSLQNEGYKVLTTASPAAGFALGRQHSPALIISNIAINFEDSQNLINLLSQDATLRTSSLIWLLEDSSTRQQLQDRLGDRVQVLFIPFEMPVLTMMVTQKMGEAQADPVRHSRVTNQAPMPSVPLSSAQTAPTDLVDGKVALVVDDEVGAQTLIAIMLERGGFDVMKAKNAKDALKKLEEKTPDVMILDVMMPGMDGIELTKVIRQRPEHQKTPILILSARGDAESVMRGLNAGASDYLPKPILHHDLISKVHNALRDNNNT